MNESTPKRGIGCGGIGLLLLLIVGFIVIGGAAIGYFVVTNQLLPYTSETPVLIQPVKATEPDYQAIRAKVDAARSPKPGSTLELTAQDLNILLAFAPEWQKARGHALIRIADKKVHIDGSFSMPNLPRVKGRYFNGTVTFVPTVVNKAFLTDIQEVSSGGKSMPPDVEKKVDTGFEEALRDSLLRDPVIGPVLLAAKGVEVTDQAVVLHF